MTQFTGISFLWIKDLSYPDTIINLPFSIYLLGDSINLLHIYDDNNYYFINDIFQNKYMLHQELKKRKEDFTS